MLKKLITLPFRLVGRVLGILGRTLLRIARFSFAVPGEALVIVLLAVSAFVMFLIGSNSSEPGFIDNLVVELVGFFLGALATILVVDRLTASNRHAAERRRLAERQIGRIERDTYTVMVLAQGLEPPDVVTEADLDNFLIGAYTDLLTIWPKRLSARTARAEIRDHVFGELEEELLTADVDALSSSDQTITNLRRASRLLASLVRDFERNCALDYSNSEGEYSRLTAQCRSIRRDVRRLEAAVEAGHDDASVWTIYLGVAQSVYLLSVYLIDRAAWRDCCLARAYAGVGGRLTLAFSGAHDLIDVEWGYGERTARSSLSIIKDQYQDAAERAVLFSSDEFSADILCEGYNDWFQETPCIYGSLFAAESAVAVRGRTSRVGALELGFDEDLQMLRWLAVEQDNWKLRDELGYSSVGDISVTPNSPGAIFSRNHWLLERTNDLASARIPRW